MTDAIIPVATLFVQPLSLLKDNLYVENPTSARSAIITATVGEIMAVNKTKIAAIEEKNAS